jgi:hypothetical protein
MIHPLYVMNSNLCICISSRPNSTNGGSKTYMMKNE